MVHMYPGYSNNEFLLYDFVATRISFGCSRSPLHFTCCVQASTVTTSLQHLLTLLSVIFVIRWYIFYISLHDVLIVCLYVCISEPLQKLRVRLLGG